MVVTGALTIGGTLLALHWRGLAQLHAAIPPRPDVSAHPEALSAALQGAATQARSAEAAEARAGLATLGRIYHANGYLREAAQCWATLQRVDPDNPRWSYYLADVQRLAGNEANMRPLLETTVALAPEYAPAWLKLGHLNFAEGDFDRAAEDFRQRLLLMPEDSYAALGLARVALKREQRTAAKHWLQKAIAGTPDIPLGHNLLAGILAETGDAEGAAEQRWKGTESGRYREAPDPWIDALSDWCYDLDRLMILGSIDFQTQHEDYGRKFFERVIELDPDNPEPYDAIARAYLETNQLEPARDILSRGLEATTGSTITYTYLSDALRRLELPEEALRVAEQGLERNPGDPDLLNARGKALGDLERYDEAVASYEASMIDVMHSAQANLNIALLKEKTGHEIEAYVYAKRALELRPKDPRALGIIGLLELNAGRLDSAEEYLGEFYRGYPGSNRARYLMTLLHFQKSLSAASFGDPATTEASALAGLEISPDSAQLNSVLGTLYVQQERYAEAIDPLERARAITPTDPSIILPLVQAYGNLRRLEDTRRVLQEAEKAFQEAGNEAGLERVRDILRTLPPAREGP